jgi:DNA-binding MarR family transcriptional regulator
MEKVSELFRASQVDADLLDEAASEVLGVNRTDHRVLDVLDRLQPITAGTLASEAGLSPAAMTASIDRLERAGYARRVRDEADRRRILVETTPAAREKAGVIYGPMGESFTREMSRYPTEFLEQLLELLQRAHELSREHRERIEGMRSRRGRAA